MRMRCLRCGARFKDARFCPNCGLQMRRQQHSVDTGGGGYAGGDVRAGRDYIGRDFIGRDKNDIHDSSGLYYVTSSSGFSRFLMVLGILIALVGFGLFGYAFVDSFSQGFGPGEPNSAESFGSSKLDTFVPIGMGLAFAGGIIYTIGILLYRIR
jgi:hypothetical protein